MTALAGTGTLVRLILRRDRFLLSLWVVYLGIIPAALTAALVELFPTRADRLAYAAGTASSSSFVALFGPVFGSSAGALGTQRAGIVLPLAGLFSLLTVIRHTRTEEETGRRELLGSSVVGRHTPLSAVLLVVFGANLMLGALTAAGLLLADLPAGGALAFGLVVAAAGWVFAAVGAVAAQLTQAVGAARGIAVSALGVAVLLRAAGDVAGSPHDGSWLSWLSSIGWLQRVRPFAGERWWLLVPAVAVVLVLAAAAYALASRRDLAAGVLPSRPGAAAAAQRLRSPLALAWRLHRGSLAGWAAGFAVGGAVLGGVADAAGQAMRDSPELQDLIARVGGGSPRSDAYLAAVTSIFGLAAAAYAILAALRPRSEETALRAEPVLATAVGRLPWATSHLAFTLLGPAVALGAFGLAAGLTSGLSSGDVSHQLPRLLVAALVQLPAVWALGAVAAALFGLYPRRTPASWGALGACLLLGQLGAILRLDQWLLDLSPFTHVPRLPGAELSVTPLVWLLACAAVLTAAGLAGFRRRDTPVP